MKSEKERRKEQKNKSERNEATCWQMKSEKAKKKNNERAKEYQQPRNKLGDVSGWCERRPLGRKILEDDDVVGDRQKRFRRRDSRIDNNLKACGD